jgi:hypothetical protein
MEMAVERVVLDIHGLNGAHCIDAVREKRFLAMTGLNAPPRSRCFPGARW